MAFDTYMKIDGIPGECTDDKHKGWIELLSYSAGVSQGAVGTRSDAGAASSGRADHSDFSIVKRLDKASPKLALACCNGEHIKGVEIQICRATKDATPYMIYKLSDVIITSYRPGGSSGGGDNFPTEEVAFNYGKINQSYTETNPKTGAPGGKVESEWDRTINKGK